jgi:NAD(P)-dependent dehydrogenase (short-subunit alcohol dehydrogenase family)
MLGAHAQGLTEPLHVSLLQGRHRATPAARRGAIDRLAGIAVFPASAASDFVAGSAAPVDGGYSVTG